ncbi:MAG: copper resistance CopC family protein [Pseudonocardia sp.]
MTTRTLRAVALTVLCGLALLAGTAPAFAHARLLSSDPADGASLSTAPERVSLTFNENMQPGFTTLTVIGPDGGAYQSGEVTADGAVVSIAVAPLGPAGRYEIGYRVVSEDGHPVTGSVGFTLTTSGPGAAAAPPPTTDTAPPASVAAPELDPNGGGGVPVWLWIVGAIVLVGGGIVAALRLGRG